MQRNFIRGLLVCLIPCLVAAIFVVRPQNYRLGIDLAGGTILVYEINLERTKARKEVQGEAGAAAPAAAPQPGARAEGLSSEDMNTLAAQIKRRIDPTDIKNVTVRPSGNSRVEIILPTGGATTGNRENLSAEGIEEVKRLISQMGVLEFRILANGIDDQAGLIAARQLIEGKSAGELEDRARKGLPPEAPADEFNVDIGESKARVRYVWSEIGPEQRESLGLSNASEGAGGLWGVLAGQRDKPVAVRDNAPADYVNCSMLLFSRKVVSTEQLAKEEADAARIKGENPGKTDAEIEALVNRKKYEYFVLTRVSPEDSLRVGGNDGQITISASAGTDPKSLSPCVEFQFNTAGGQQFTKITRRNKPTGSTTRNLAILLDDRVVSAPTLQSEIGNRGQITGKFDRKSVDRLVQILKSGALSAELREKPVSENTIGPTLGQDTIVRGTTAVGGAFVAVLAFMLVYYRFAGLVACVALFANLLLTIGFMVAVNAAFTLPGLAGLVLTLGMAVDANVLIYERLREERNRGANIATALRNGYERAFLTIIDTHLTSIFTAIVLYTFGNDQLKGFAISLTVGLVISLFTSLYMTRLMFDFWLHKKWLTDLKMMQLFARPNFHPMKMRYIFFPLTAVLTVAGLAVFVVRGEAGLNVDFRGGTVFAGKLKDGEERGLTKTADGKDGFRELLGEEAQKKRLALKAGDDAVIWENRPSGDERVNTWIYTVTYEDGTRATVTLTAKPEGGTDADMREDVRQRAAQLPDVSVEQMFISGQQFEMGKSRYFTIRTTEKQRDLVQTSLNRLLVNEKGDSIMSGATMTPGAIAGPVVTIDFDKPTSRSFTQELFEREFRKVGAGGPDDFSLTGIGEAKEGRFSQMKLDVSRNQALSLIGSAANAPGVDQKARADQLKALQEIVAGAKRAFDATPEPERLEVFDTQLASDTREKAMMAIVASWVAILLYLWFRFGNWTFGLAAVICLVHDLCFTIGAIAVCHYLHMIPGFSHLGIEDFKIDLTTVAALLTLVGYSVNEIIVNFARLREVRGKNPQLTPQMINDSVNQTLSRTILTSMTVFLASIVLYAFGGEGVHLFAFVMVVGVLVSTYSSIFVASPLLLFLGEGRDGTATPDEAAATDKEEGAGATEEEVVEG
ncbi:bifunctional preprotein translocase subunit SecD/SecF [Gemmata obscuriglobus]|uniref:Multifunctional fusion protein n=1 Tax=Gemmata obscuriglobus TaxID=114 RepID=A0A2Z3H4Y8_9BACT|nr:protein translocase subunit SecD [Gemmata obscuriglobus]AWM41073.1 protein translocase subunit SecD [Gemmata obscuriglobus]QEG25600.1 bifunctional preprotein translocase subunit SecD/SecF [Gemmata obscuriglobus]VTR99070.1 protein-export membrane protein secd : SecF protein OS=Rhodopirellula baltica SH28 GN=RBSH_00957 PE=3 SV=1: SecD_SecF: SecD_SecF [Gemmata obscuriglobus UQM 2246]